MILLYVKCDVMHEEIYERITTLVKLFNLNGEKITTVYEMSDEYTDRSEMINNIVNNHIFCEKIIYIEIPSNARNYKKAEKEFRVLLRKNVDIIYIKDDFKNL